MPKTVAYFCQLTNLTVSRLLLLPRHMAITGYQINSGNSNSQQKQLPARQTSKSLPGEGPPTRVKTITNRIYV